MYVGNSLSFYWALSWREMTHTHVRHWIFGPINNPTTQQTHHNLLDSPHSLSSWSLQLLPSSPAPPPPLPQWPPLWPGTLLLATVLSLSVKNTVLTPLSSAPETPSLLVSWFFVQYLNYLLTAVVPVIRRIEDKNIIFYQFSLSLSHTHTNSVNCNCPLTAQMPPRKPESIFPTVAVPVPAQPAAERLSPDLLTNPSKPSLMMTRWVKDSFLLVLPTLPVTAQSKSTRRMTFSKLRY